jgi:methylation protein EvaC
MVLMDKNICKICGSARLHKIIDFGKVPNANNLVTKAELNNVKNYSLVFYWCQDCTLFQQIEPAPREDLFNLNYTYKTGVNVPSVQDFKSFATRMSEQLPRRDFAVVIASNDGTEIELLEEYGGFKKVIGVDPSANVAEIANRQGFLTVVDYFGHELSEKMVKKHGNADLVVAKGVFAHIPDPKDMLAGMKNLINENGTIMIEIHWLKSLVEHAEIDSLYAEHYYEFDMKAMKVLADSLSLKIVDAEYLPHMQGGEIRFIIKKHGDDAVVEKFMKEEETAGLYTLEGMKKLQERAEERKKKLVALIKGLKAKNKSIAVWSAAAKVPTTFNYCGITNAEVDCAYEISEYKIGKYIPKSNIPVKSELLMEHDMPDYLILGSWNYIEFAKKHLKWYTDKGGKFIDPLNCVVIET